MTKELIQEYTRKITQANKTQMITILYELLLIYAKEGKEAFAKEERREFRNAIRKMRGCINELLASLNFEYELSQNFLQLYLYMNRELVAADVKNIAEPIQNVERIATKLRNAYEQLGTMDQSAPVMENTQTVYAGLTYGKKDLTESLADQGSGRGFRV